MTFSEPGTKDFVASSYVKRDRRFSPRKLLPPVAGFRPTKPGPSFGSVSLPCSPPQYG